MDPLQIQKALNFLILEGSVLDVACGDGSIAELLPGSIEYWGIDPQISPGAARLIKARPDKLPFADESFDTVLSYHAMENMEDPAGFLAEANRALAPRGKLAIVCTVNNSNRECPIRWRWGQDDFLALVGRHFAVRTWKMVKFTTVLVNAEKEVTEPSRPSVIAERADAIPMTTQPALTRTGVVSFIVSAWNRPMRLEAAIISLALQSHPHEIIVTDNSEDQGVLRRNRKTCEKYGARWIPTREAGAYHCYESAEMGIPFATGEWLSFPSDDGYYVPGYAETMIKFAEQRRLDFVYCDLIMDPRMFRNPPRWDVLRVEARPYHIDKNCFMVRRSKFQGFPDKGVIGDGHFIESLVKRGLRHAKAPGVLVVHN